MYELRILSGLHRGATLPLDDHPYVIGASDDDQVVLVDPGIEAQHATLSRTDSGWLLSATNGDIYAADSNELQTLIDLGPGDFVRVGKVWIVIVLQDARWENPPPEPDKMQFTAADDWDASMTDGVAVDGATAATPADSERSTTRGRRGRRMLFVPVALVAVLSAAAAYAMSSKSSTSLSPGKVDIQSDIGSRSVARGSNKPATGGADGNKRSEKQLADADRVLPPAELRAAFRKRLADADLLSRVDLTLNEQSWTMRAALDDEETRRFERILVAFMAAHHITFPVNAKVNSAESMLPFKINQVISGANASVVTQDGDRLYVGDEYRGVRVVAIQGNHLVFAGKRKIEVNW